MKLLLTSGGLRNQTLIQSLISLVGRPIQEVNVAFIPTAMHPEPGDKGWALDQMQRLRDMGIHQLDIVDIAAVPKSVWLPRLEESHVIFVNGGNTTYLMTACNESGLSAELPRLLKDRVYVGASAGSYIANPDIRFNSDANATGIMPGLGLVNFGIQAHLGNVKFDIVKDEAHARARVAGTPYRVYVLGDESAVQVNGGSVSVVGEGNHFIVEPGE